MTTIDEVKAAVLSLNHQQRTRLLFELLEEDELSYVDLSVLYATALQEQRAQARTKLSDVTLRLAMNWRRIPKQHSERALAAQAILEAGTLGNAIIAEECRTFLKELGP